VLAPSNEIVNGANNVTIEASNGVLRASQQINGGGGINTLDLEGGGIFNLAAPAVLENIQIVNATEGSGTAEPFIFLRNGLNLTLNLLDPVGGAVVHGASNSDVINLGSGNDTVYVGSGETVYGGSGTDWFTITSATTGETIAGDSSGINDLYVQGGGTVAMGGSITNMNAVFLVNAGTSYNFTANATPGLIIHASADSDTITVGDPSQSVFGSSGNLLVLATAANAGVAIRSGTGSNTLEITTGGMVALNSGLRNITVELEAASTLTLPTNTTVAIDGIAGNDVFVATNGVLHGGESVTGGGSNNTLVAQGGGLFRLDEPATLANVQVLDATEGQGSAEQFIFLRNGLDLTLNLGSAATNPQSAGAVVHGATNDDIINLGSGSDTVYVGSGETVNGGSGKDLFYITSATTGETIAGDSSGTNDLYVQGGGTVAMGGSITNMNAVFLVNAGTSYNFTANATPGLIIHASADSDTITVGAPSQTVIGSSGSLDVLATAANAGVAIRSGTGSNELDITSSGTTMLNSSDNNLTVQLDAANTTLTLDHMTFIHAEGTGGNDLIIAGAAGQVLTGGGANDTLDDASHYGVTFLDTVAGFAGDTLSDFTKVDTIDITNLTGVTNPPMYTGTSSSGTLAVIGSSGTVDINMTNLKTGGAFSAVSDGHGGTLISYT
jgi:Ca2+-binding RTX toxin-like protein